MNKLDQISYFRRLRNPFAIRGDPLSDEDVAIAFAIPEGFIYQIQERFHNRIEGHLGSGKTMLLRANSYATRTAMESLQPSKAHKAFSGNFLGIYISFCKEHTSIFQFEEDSPLLRRLFLLWLESYIAYEWFSSVELYVGKNAEGIDSLNKCVQFALESIGATFLSRKTSKTDLPVIFDRLAQAARRSVSVDGQVMFPKTFEALENVINSLPRPEEFLHMIIYETLAALPKIQGIMPCYLLLDSFEELSESFQMLANGFFNWRPNQIFYTKACSLPGGFRTRKDVSGREYIIPDEVHETQIRWETPSDDYAKFCIRVARNHLFRFSQMNRNLQIQTHPRKLFDRLTPVKELAIILGILDEHQINKLIRQQLGISRNPKDEEYRQILFHEIHKKGSAKLYSGLTEIIALSSGNIRIFVRLCECSFQFESDKIGNKAYRSISTESQGKGTLKVAKEYFEGRLRATTHSYEREVRGLLSLFLDRVAAGHYKSAHDAVWKKLCIFSEDNSTLVMDPILEEAINLACRVGILIAEEASDQRYTYGVPTVFAPIRYLNYDINGTLELSITEVVRSVIPLHRKKRTKDETGKGEQGDLFSLPLEKPRVFISCPEVPGKGPAFVQNGIRKVVEKTYGGEIIGLSEAETQMLPDAIKDVIMKQASVIFVDITRLIPNVLFEYGIAIAAQIAAYPIYNNARRKYDPTRIPDYLQGLRVLKYTSGARKPTLFESKIMKCIENWQKRLTTHPQCPVKSSCPFPTVNEESLISVLPLMSRISSKEWLDEDFSIIRSVARKKSLNVEKPPEKISTRYPKICTRCALIRRSNNIIIELSQKDHENALFLGLAFGFNKEPITYIRGRGPHSPSCWQGKGVAEIMKPEDLESIVSNVLG